MKLPLYNSTKTLFTKGIEDQIFFHDSGRRKENTEQGVAYTEKRYCEKITKEMTTNFQIVQKTMLHFKGRRMRVAL